MLSNRPTTLARNKMELYVIYENPTDFPGKFVLRRWRMEKPDPQPLKVGDTLFDVRIALPRNVVNIGRMHGDDACIVEVHI